MFNRRKKIAIKAFEVQKEKLNNNQYYNDSDWVAQTSDIAKKYIGGDSSQYAYITNFKFGIYKFNPLESDSEQMHFELDRKVRKAERYINNCIEYIKLNGIKKEPKINFIQKLSDRVVWSILVAIATLAYFIGSQVKSYQIDKEKIKLEQKIETQNKQIEDFKSILKSLNELKNE